MNARYYLPYINRFLSADTIVPDPANPQTFNRYSYVNNNPVIFVDPSGHFTEEAIKQYLQDHHDDWQSVLSSWMSDADWWAVLRAAQAGDTLLASYYGYWSQGWGNEGVSEDAMGGSVKFTFTGSGHDVLTGISFEEREWFAGHRIGLNDVFTGYYESGFGNYMDAYELEWSAISMNITWGALLRNGIIPIASDGSPLINRSKSYIQANTGDKLVAALITIPIKKIFQKALPVHSLVVDVGWATYSVISKADYTDGQTLRHSYGWYMVVPGAKIEWETVVLNTLSNPNGNSRSFQIGIDYR